MHRIFGQGKLLFKIILFSLGLFFTSRVFATEVQKADLSLTPTTQDVSINQTFTVDVIVDGKSNQISAADIQINYDPEFLSAESITAGTHLPTVLVPGNVDNTNGSATITLGAQINSAPSGQGILATLQFKAIKNTQVPTQIIINPGSAVSAIGQNGNIAGTITNAGATVGESAVTKTASFDLTSTASNLQAGGEFTATLRAFSSVDESNLFSADIGFDPGLLEVIKVETGNSFISQWASNTYDNQTGKIKLTGGVPSPGFKTPELGSDMAVIYFKAKKAGTSLTDFSPLSAIFRNSDNADILKSTTPLVVEISSATPTPAPTTTPAPTPTPSSTPTPIVTPVPTPSPCVITAASWGTTGPVSQGIVVSLSLTGSGDCNGKSVEINVKEDDGLLGSQNTLANPANAVFSGNTASTSWISEYQTDGIFGVWDPPEYYFNAKISGSQSVFKSTNKLIVTKLLIGQFPKGDADFDGKVNLKDLSMIFTHWNKSQNFPFNLDMNDDGLINTFDLSAIRQLLITANIL